MATTKKTTKKANVKVGDLKPKKDAKGGAAAKRPMADRGRKSLDGKVGRQVN